MYFYRIAYMINDMECSRVVAGANYLAAVHSFIDILENSDTPIDEVHFLYATAIA